MIPPNNINQGFLSSRDNQSELPIPFTNNSIPNLLNSTKIESLNLNNQSEHAGELQKQLARYQCYKQVKKLLYDKIVSHIIPGQPIVLLNTPTHWNLGDSYIWEGNKLLFEHYGQSLLPYTQMNEIEKVKSVRWFNSF